MNFRSIFSLCHFFCSSLSSRNSSITNAESVIVLVQLLLYLRLNSNLLRIPSHHHSIEVHAAIFLVCNSTEARTRLESFSPLRSVESGSNHIGGCAFLKIVTLDHGHILEQCHIGGVAQNVVVDDVFHDLGLSLTISKLIICARTKSLDTKTIRIVDFSGEPVLASMVRKSLKVVTELLINLNLISILAQVEFLKALFEEFTAAHQDNETTEEEEHRNGGAILIPWESIVFRRHGFICVFHHRSHIVKDLLLTHNPVTEKEVGKRSPSHHAKSCIIKFGTVHRGLLVPVGYTKLFNNVDIKEGKTADGEHHGHGQTVHKASIDCVHTGSILEMHQMGWASVNVNILLNRFCLSLVGCATIPEVGAAFI